MYGYLWKSLHTITLQINQQAEPSSNATDVKGFRLIAIFLGFPQPLGADGKNFPELSCRPNCFQLIIRLVVRAINSVVKQSNGTPHQVYVLYR